MKTLPIHLKILRAAAAVSGIIAIVYISSLILVNKPEAKPVKIYVDVKGPIDYDSLYRVGFAVRTAKPGDEIFISIDSPGGLTKATIELIDDIYKSKGKVYCYVEGLAASAAAALASSCPVAKASPYAVLMYHQSYYKNMYTGKSYRNASSYALTEILTKRFDVVTVLGRDYGKYMSGKDVFITPERFNETHKQALINKQ